MDRAAQISLDQRKDYEVDLSVSEKTRRDQRRTLANAWLEEEENSRYRYNVELGEDGKRIFLKRPTWLNKGFDFQINLEGYRSAGKKASTAPSHADLIADLRAKKIESPGDFAKFRQAIDDVYCCAEPDEALRERGYPAFKEGLPADTLLKLLKWLFIEQDLTYWNNSGRRMFLNEINREADNQP